MTAEKWWSANFNLTWWNWMKNEMQKKHQSTGKDVAVYVCGKAMTGMVVDKC